MDPTNDMQQVRRSLEESEEKVTKLKADRYDMDLKIQLERTKVDISKIEERRQNNEYISLQRAIEERRQNNEYISLQRPLLDKAVRKEHSDFGKRMEKEQIALLNKALSDHRAIYAQKIEQERALANKVLRKARQENDDNIKNERQKFDSMKNQARAQLAELENERSKLKTLIESLIEREEVRDNMNVEVQDGMIYMPRTYFTRAVDNYCRPDVVMKFKVHKVKELYSDLQKCDLRAELREFSIARPATSVEFATFMEALSWHGYIRDAEVYYLNRGPWIGKDCRSRTRLQKALSAKRAMTHRLELKRA